MSKRFNIIQLFMWSFCGGMWFLKSVIDMKAGNVTNAGWELAVFSVIAVSILLNFKIALKND